MYVYVRQHWNAKNFQINAIFPFKLKGHNGTVFHFPRDTAEGSIGFLFKPSGSEANFTSINRQIAMDITCGILITSWLIATILDERKFNG